MKGGKNHIWTLEEVEYLKLHYPYERGDKLAEYFNIPLCCLFWKAEKLGLKKCKNYRSTEAANLNRAKDENGYIFNFKKGQPAHNKGKKLNEYMSNESIEIVKKTYFKKGNIPPHQMKDDDITIRNNKKCGKNLFIRIGPSKWIPLARKIWIDNFGPIPKGGIIIFKDRNYFNCVPENLECTTYKNNIYKNIIERYPTELMNVMKLNTRLKTKIKQYENN